MCVAHTILIVEEALFGFPRFWENDAAFVARLNVCAGVIAALALLTLLFLLFVRQFMFRVFPISTILRRIEPLLLFSLFRRCLLVLSNILVVLRNPLVVLIIFHHRTLLLSGSFLRWNTLQVRFRLL